MEGFRREMWYVPKAARLETYLSDRMYRRSDTSINVWLHTKQGQSLKMSNAPIIENMLDTFETSLSQIDADRDDQRVNFRMEGVGSDRHRKLDKSQRYRGDDSSKETMFLKLSVSEYGSSMSVPLTDEQLRLTNCIS